jgi:ferredoxin-like protein FixX
LEDKEQDLRELVKRVGETGDFLRSEESRCMGCGKCVKICPMSLWRVRKGKATLSSDYTEKCLECGACWMVCPKGAIDFRYPAGGTGVVWEFG